MLFRVAVNPLQDPKLPEKLEEWRKATGRSRVALATELKVTKSSVSNWELGQNSPSMDTLMAIASLADGEYKRFFLLQAKGKSGLSIDAMQAMSEITAPTQQAAKKTRSFVDLPLVSSLAEAGAGRVNDTEHLEGNLSVPRSFVQNPSETTCIWIEGESMLPTLPRRTIGAVDRSQRHPSKLTGKIVAAYHETHGLVIKRLLLTVDGAHRLVSDNAVYPQYELSDGWRLVGRVVWWLQTT